MASKRARCAGLNSYLASRLSLGSSAALTMTGGAICVLSRASCWATEGIGEHMLLPHSLERLRSCLNVAANKCCNVCALLSVTSAWRHGQMCTVQCSKAYLLHFFIRC